MHWGDKQSLFVHFRLFFELKSDILFICMDNMCATGNMTLKYTVIGPRAFAACACCRAT